MIPRTPSWRAIAPALALLAAALTPAACNRPRPSPARPALFVVRDADTTIWLFGTIHALPDGVDWQTPPIRAALAQADTLVTEISDAEFRGSGNDFDAMARLDPPVPAQDRVAPGNRPALARALAAAGVTDDQAARLNTWALAVLLGTASANSADARRDNAPEAVLADQARAAGKPQRALETVDGQLALFDGLAEPDQRTLLAATLTELANPVRGYAATRSAWEAGDLHRLNAALAPTFGDQPRLAERLITARNRRWAEWIAARLQRPGRVFIAVGAGHLVGAHSVLAMLQRRGFAVSRIE